MQNKPTFLKRTTRLHVFSSSNCIYVNLGLRLSLVFGSALCIAVLPSGRVACRVAIPCYWSFPLLIREVYYFEHYVWYVLHLRCVNDDY